MRKQHAHSHPSSEHPPHADMPLWRVGSWFLPAYWLTVLLLAILLWWLS